MTHPTGPRPTDEERETWRREAEDDISLYPASGIRHPTARRILALLDDLDTLRAERETLNIKLAACGVAAMLNTRESVEANRIDRENPYWSASYGDVVTAVEREMAHRERAEAAEASRDALTAQVAALQATLDATRLRESQEMESAEVQRTEPEKETI